MEIGTVQHMWIERECKKDGKLRVFVNEDKRNAAMPESSVKTFPNTWQAFFHKGVSKKVALNRLKKAMIKDITKDLMRQIKLIQELESLSE